MSSKQARAQLELNDLEPQQDPKGGDHPPIAINLSLGDGTLGGIAVGPTFPDSPLIKQARAK